MERNENITPRLGIYFLLTLTAFFWGGQFNAAKIAVEYLPPLTTGAARFFVAAVLVSFIVLWREREILAMVRRNLIIYVILGLIGVVCFNVFFFFGMRLTSPTNAALIVATNPLVTALISSVILREPVTREHKFGTVLSFVGVAALTLTGKPGSLLQVNVGDFLIAGAVTCFALYAVLGRKYLRQSTAVMTTAATMIIGAPILCAIAFAHDGAVPLIGLPVQVYLAVGFMGVLGSVLGYMFWNYGISRIGVQDTAVFFHLVPVFTVLLSIVLGQGVTVRQLLAGAVVITGVLISTGTMRRIRSRFFLPVPIKSEPCEGKY